MSENWAIALFTVFGGLLLGSYGGSIAAYVSIAQRLRALEVSLDFMGKSQARVLRSPHTPELDAYIDKHVAGTLTREDAIKYVELCDEVEQDKSNSKQERACAGGLAVSIRREFRLPMVPIRHHDE
jgi:hypothetical protein